VLHEWSLSQFGKITVCPWTEHSDTGTIAQSGKWGRSLANDLVNTTAN